MRYATIGRHGKKGSVPGATGLWKPETPLTAEAVSTLETIGGAYLGPIAKAFCSTGFVRTRQSAKALCGMEPFEADELSPLTLHDDASWGSICTHDGKELSPAEIMTIFPRYILPVGDLGAKFIRDEISQIADGQSLLFISHQPVVEPILAVLLNQWPLKIPVPSLSEGDLVSLGFAGDEIHSVEYLAAKNAVNALGIRSIPDHFDR